MTFQNGAPRGRGYKRVLRQGYTLHGHCTGTLHVARARATLHGHVQVVGCAPGLARKRECHGTRAARGWRCM